MTETKTVAVDEKKPRDLMQVEESRAIQEVQAALVIAKRADRLGFDSCGRTALEHVSNPNRTCT